jgi:PEP-CTERM motif
MNSPSTVVPYNGGVNAFLFGRVFYPNIDSFDGGVMTFPGPASPQAFNISGFLDCCGDNGRGYQTGYMTPADLNTNYPSIITYTLTATNSMTSASESVNISYQDVFTSDIPQLTAASFSALQGANPNVGMTVDFNSFTPNAGADFGQGFFTIYDSTTDTVAFSDSGFMPTTTAISFGPGTLAAGNQYEYELIFDDGINSSYNGIATTARSDQRTLGFFSAAVPEPSTWAMLLAGFAGLGFAGYRRGRGRAVVGRG